MGHLGAWSSGLMLTERYVDTIPRHGPHGDWRRSLRRARLSQCNLRSRLLDGRMHVDDMNSYHSCALRVPETALNSTMRRDSSSSP